MCADCIFTDWAGTSSPITLSGQSSTHLRNTTFQNMRLAVELADVSGGSAARFSNVSLTNVTLERGAVVSTTNNDYTTGDDCYLVYYADDDAAYDVAATPAPMSAAAPPDSPRADADPNADDGACPGTDTVIVDETGSDCLYLLAPEGLVLPGCASASAVRRRRMRAGETDAMVLAHDGSGDVCSASARHTPSTAGHTFLSPEDPWLEAVRKVLLLLVPRVGQAAKTRC